MYTYEKRKKQHSQKNDSYNKITTQLMIREEPDPNYDEAKMGQLRNWRRKNPSYDNFLNNIETTLQRRIPGDNILREFYKGAHIVLTGRDFYEQLKRDLTDLHIPHIIRGAYGPFGSSHYDANTKNEFNHSNPQYGVDLPSPMTGHILFGLTGTEENTFIQTEMAGFQEIKSKLSHGMGWFWNVTGGWQSGFAGYSRHSEKTGTEIRDLPIEIV